MNVWPFRSPLWNHFSLCSACRILCLSPPNLLKSCCILELCFVARDSCIGCVDLLTPLRACRHMQACVLYVFVDTYGASPPFSIAYPPIKSTQETTCQKQAKRTSAINHKADEHSKSIYRRRHSCKLNVESLCLQAKQEADEQFKLGNFQESIRLYTIAIEQNAANGSMAKHVLLSNRSAAYASLKQVFLPLLFFNTRIYASAKPLPMTLPSLFDQRRGQVSGSRRPSCHERFA